MLGGSLRGMYSGALILLLSIPFGATMRITPLFLLVMLLNGMTFAALGVLAAIIARTHGDIARFSTFAILPMTFLCNTFFPLELSLIHIFKEQYPDACTVFIGPCYAKKGEAAQSDSVDYAITFYELREWMRAADVSPVFIESAPNDRKRARRYPRQD